MKSWKVQIRGKSGKTESIYVDADDRSSVFKIARERSLTIISVDEAKGKRPSSADGKPAVGKGLVAGLIVAICGALAVWYFLPQSTPSAAPAAEKARKPKSDLPDVVIATPTPVDAPAEVKKEEIVDDTPPHKKIVEVISVVTNADGTILERFKTADGKTRSRQSAPKPVFDNASDQLIAMAISGSTAGGAMPPMPVMSNADEEFKKSLEKDIVINEDDSEDVKRLKEQVMATREDMRQLMAEGKTFAEVLQEHRELVNHHAAIRADSVKILQELVDNGETAEADLMLKEVNEMLSGMGVEAVEMPLSREERRQAIREQHGK